MASNKASTLIFFFTSLGPLEFAGEEIVHDQRGDERGDAEILLRIVVEHEQIELIAAVDQTREQFVHPEFFLVRPLADRIQQAPPAPAQINRGCYPSRTRRRGKELAQIGVVKIGVSVGVEFPFSRVIGLQLRSEEHTSELQ